MGMLMVMSMMEQEEAARKVAEAAETVPNVKDEEIPFAEHPVEEPVRERHKTQNRKPATVTRRRKPVK